VEKLSQRQKLILEFIEREVAEKGYPPSVREIGEAVGLASSSTVHGHLGKLESKGYIRRDPTKPRAIELLAPSAQFQRTNRNIVNVPIVGKVTAGQPILAVENIETHFPISREFIPGDSDIFSLNVSGDSMIEAGIFDGDIVFVRRQEYAANGDIVVAMIDDEATVKRFFREADHIRLQPENSTMSPILAPQVTILGKVIGVFRYIR
jgi:repressor LexA